MKTQTRWLLGIVTGLILFVLGAVAYNNPPLFSKTVQLEDGTLELSQVAWGVSSGLMVAFVDTKQYPATELSKRLAAKGLIAAVMDTQTFVNHLKVPTGQCVEPTVVSTTLTSLLTHLPPEPTGTQPIVAGLAEGALIPFLNAQAPALLTDHNLSVGFSLSLPNNLVLCPNSVQAISTATLKSHWRSAWTDQPDAKTGVLVKELGVMDIRIAAYDTPLDSLLLDELNRSLGQLDSNQPPMPTVEVPTNQPSENVTLFYSGDGGWRDLDKTVASEMVKLNYPVVGVDVLRYFWEHKTPEQAAADLSATMAYYRSHWHVKSFVLTGYSFGADILPVLYNRLPQQDKDSVSLLVLIALAETADFEIHVSGWLGSSAGEMGLAPELAIIPKQKILCIYGSEEKTETACTDLRNTEATLLELQGGHHFDQDYPKLTRQIIAVYQQKGIN